MSAQFPLNFSLPAARKEGMQAALAHAEREHSDWAARAYKYLINACRMREFIFAEQITAEAEAWDLPSPPTTRAWGGIYVRAQHEKIIEATGKTKKRKNGSPAMIYASLIYKKMP